MDKLKLHWKYNKYGYQLGGICGSVALVVLGWVCNLVKIAYMTDVSGMLVLRTIGVFIPPIGAVLGFI